MEAEALTLEFGVVGPDGSLRKTESDRLFTGVTTFIRDAGASDLTVTKQEREVPEGTLGIAWGGALKAVLAGSTACGRLVEFVWRAVKWMAVREPRPSFSIKFVFGDKQVELAAAALASIDDLGRVQQLATALIQQLGLVAPPPPA
jgi:hypothetical protein